MYVHIYLCMYDPYIWPAWLEGKKRRKSFAFA